MNTSAPPAANETFEVPLKDGCSVEAMYYPTGTLCISTQVGCAMGCGFCASGAGGLHRNLTLAELWQQLSAARGRGWEPGRVTLSGVGEPLHNLAACEGFLLGARDQEVPVSLTTTGHPLPALVRLFTLPHNGVMLSLHAGTAATHRRLLPHGPDFGALWDALAGAWRGLSRARRRKIGINMLLFAGVNDTWEEVDALTDRLAPYPEVTVHLLTPNPVPGSLFRAPEEDQVRELWNLLRSRGFNARRANPWRRQQKGGCGTLVARNGATERQAPADPDPAAESSLVGSP